MLRVIRLFAVSWASLVVLALCGHSRAAAGEAKALDANARVSFHKQLRPILQANCYGCHQPAKAKGGYAMTVFDKLLAGGESNEPAIVRGDPGKSGLYQMIVPSAGEAEMPKGKKPLAQVEIDLVRKWIAEGAVDDTPENARPRFDMDRPPVYTRQPVIASLDFSPDGRLLAVAGFHEVLLYRADGSERIARLVGLSERIQSVRFSPDGKQLAVTGGLPARSGEVQIWDVALRKLALSVPTTYDTLYGLSWSPDGKRIAFGCADNTVRAIDAKTGEQVLYQAAHSDWPLGTVFSVDGSHVVSVGRDRTAKLIELGTQRFVDNITSITPGALKGGIAAVARHPKRDEIVIGGADGVPKIYRMHRETKRVIGDDSNLIRIMPAMSGRIWNIAVSRDGRRFAAGSGLDGVGEVAVFSYEMDTTLPEKIKVIMNKRTEKRSLNDKAALDQYHVAGVKRISRTPVERGAVYAVAFRPDGRVVAAAGSDGAVRLIDPATGAVVKEFAPAPLQAATPGAVAGAPAPADAVSADFIRDVNPVMTKLGCNQGTCHGSLQGKNGFKLSLRGYDPVEDVRALTDDLGSRRTNVASPDDSLMLLKTTGAVPHEGGKLVQPGDDYYQILRTWIARGSKLDVTTPRVARIEVSPANPVLGKPQDQQAMRVVATYPDGKTRDVTREAFIESGNTEVASADRAGVVTALRRGEAAVLARYEGAYAATTLTVMGDRSGFVWEQPPTWNRIDELVAEKWKRVKLRPSALSTDAEFVRRLYLDLTGLPPPVDKVRAFMADARPTRAKREELVGKLVGSEAYVDHWTNKWGDLLQVNRKFLGAEGATAFRQWIRDEVAKNTPHDQFVRKILTATGSNRDNPAASYYKILRDPGALTENTTHLFLAVRMNCNKCHDHPFERWTQDQYFETAAYFARVGLRADPAAEGATLGKTAVEGAKPLFEIVSDLNKGEVKHDRTGKVIVPKFPYEAKFDASETASRREQIASWVTSPDNQYFAKSYVNRLWGYLLGTGIVEPIDDIRAGNPPTNPQLLDYLTRELVTSGFDTRHIVRLICTSRTYQLSVATNKWNQDDKTNYAHAIARRLPAEVLYDAVHEVTGSVSRPAGLPAGTRAAAFPDSGVELPGGFLATFGRPPRESPCECERTSELRLGAVMSLVSGPTIAEAIADPENAIATLVGRQKDDAALVADLYLRILNRPATPKEIVAALGTLRVVDEDHRKLAVAFGQRSKEVGGARAKAEKERQIEVAKAKAELDAYEKEVGPGIAEQERRRTAEMAKRDDALRAYEETLPAKLTEWEKKQKVTGDWVPLVATELESTSGVKLVAESDFSVYTAEDRPDPGEFIFTAETDLRGITAIRLEALPDKRLPGGGPGKGQGGRFLLNEFTVQAAPKARPTKAQKVALKSAVANFTEPGYDVRATIESRPEKKPGKKSNNAKKKDGQGEGDEKEKNARNKKGWAITHATGVGHWATFEPRQALGFPGGTVLTFTLRQDAKPAAGVREAPVLGRFRISVTTGKRPVGLGLSDDLRVVLSRESGGEDSSKLRTAPLLQYLRAIDPELHKLVAAAAESKKPLPVDKKLKELRDRLDLVSRPIPEDARIVQLRHDVSASEKQIANRRLTVAQDLAWALINSPAFLFNH